MWVFWRDGHRQAVFPIRRPVNRYSIRCDQQYHRGNTLLVYPRFETPALCPISAGSGLRQPQALTKANRACRWRRMASVPTVIFEPLKKLTELQRYRCPCHCPGSRRRPGKQADYEEEPQPNRAAVPVFVPRGTRVSSAFPRFDPSGSIFLPPPRHGPFGRGTRAAPTPAATRNGMSITYGLFPHDRILRVFARSRDHYQFHGHIGHFQIFPL